ncbi:MAG: hypothetical protein M1819_006152 [Sarea resinae]|nr:MAG: hypothetical protein M1819_006152 [Sarea resinae]
MSSQSMLLRMKRMARSEGLQEAIHPAAPASNADSITNNNSEADVDTRESQEPSLSTTLTPTTSVCKTLQETKHLEQEHDGAEQSIPYNPDPVPFTSSPLAPIQEVSQEPISRVHNSQGPESSISKSLDSVLPLPDSSPLTSKAATASPSPKTNKEAAALSAKERKNKSQKARKLLQRNLRRQAWCSQMKRSQRYLGLLSDETAAALPLTGPPYSLADFSPAGQRAIRQRDDDDDGTKPAVTIIDVSRPAPHAPESAPVFIAIDVEAYERDHKKITEIGVSQLDTHDLVALAPGPNGINWMSKIRSRHFRIREYAHLLNTDFMTSCGDNFEFGDSEWISIHDAARVMEECFSTPFPSSADQNATAANTPTPKSSTENTNMAEEKTYKARPLVLVGHDPGNDVGYLSAPPISFHAFSPPAGHLPNLLETLDTRALYSALHRTDTSRALGHILLGLGQEAWHLHNAGNDAAYTMRAMLGMCVADLGTCQGHRWTGDMEDVARDYDYDCEDEDEDEGQIHGGAEGTRASGKAKERAEAAIRLAEEWRIVVAGVGDGGSVSGGVGAAVGRETDVAAGVSFTSAATASTADTGRRFDGETETGGQTASM